MPLIKSKSKKAVSENIKTEMDAGKDQKQSIAIALDLQRRAKKKMAKGGEIMKDPDELSLEMPSMMDEEDEMESPQGSVSDRIRQKKMMMAKGGEVDLDHNSDEDLNLEDQLSFEAARKHTYYDDSQLEEQPMDSNEHGDKLSDEDMHDMVSAIRRKMKSKKI